MLQFVLECRLLGILFCCAIIYPVMKANTHPKYNSEVKVICSCGNTFTTGSTLEELKVELCSNCHPFYTGKQRIVDTENLVKKFEKRAGAASKDAITKRKEKRESRRRKGKVTEIKADKEITLKDMLKDFDKDK
jgi:large subunit ribosomal protein L31